MLKKTNSATWHLKRLLRVTNVVKITFTWDYTQLAKSCSEEKGPWTLYA